MHGMDAGVPSEGCEWEPVLGRCIIVLSCDEVLHVNEVSPSEHRRVRIVRTARTGRLRVGRKTQGAGWQSRKSSFTTLLGSKCEG